MNTCRTIEPLLYLHRDGECTAEQQRIVEDHVARCAACAKLLSDLRTLDEALAAERTATVAWKPSVVNAMADEFSHAGRAAGRPTRGAELVWHLIRPAFGTIVAVAAGILLIQLVQDGMQVASLERRLETKGGAVQATMSSDELQPLRALQPGSLDEPAGLSRASINPLELLGPGLLNLFQQNNRLFESLERKYPRLSTITTDDGLDERERTILATEGKAFLADIQQLLREGEPKQ